MPLELHFYKIVENKEHLPYITVIFLVAQCLFQCS